MESLYLLLPISVLLVLAVIGIFAWALSAGQFDDLSREAWRVLEGGEREPQPPPAGQDAPVAPGSLNNDHPEPVKPRHLLPKSADSRSRP